MITSQTSEQLNVMQFLTAVNCTAADDDDDDDDDDECNYLIHDVLQDDTKETAPDTIDTDRHAVCYTDQPEVGVLCSATYSRQSTIG